jgi:hypothetical protein
MVPSNLRPKWWQLYLALPLLVVLFVADSRLRISTRGHQAVQIGILLLVYGLISLWLKANASALSGMDQVHHRGRIRVVRVSVFQLPDADEERRQMFELPLVEDKGVLSDTFERDYIDVEALPEERADGRHASVETINDKQTSNEKNI